MKSMSQGELDFRESLVDIYDPSEAEEIYSLVLEAKFGISRKLYSLNKADLLSEEQEAILSAVLAELKKGRPVQHILNQAHFYGEVYEVNQYVLIPRAETEELVHHIIQRHQSNAQDLRIMDIGTGSGCIPISLKKHLPQAQITTLDISKEALNTAKKNAQNLQVDIHFINADILEWEYLFSTQKYDIIVSNPPYITPKEKVDMERHVLEFEPHLALFVEEVAPLLFYETIASFALSHLQEHGDLYFEINKFYAKETCEMLQKKGFKQVQLLQDIYGADRMIHARLTEK